MADQRSALRVDGNVAHDAVDVGDPIKIGGRARAGTPSAVVDQDRVDAWFELQGQQAMFIVDNGGTVVAVSANRLTTQPDGTLPSGSADSGNPIKIGGKAYTTLPAAVDTSDRVDAIYTTQGAATVAGVDGTTPRALAVNASGQLEVDIAAQQGGTINVAAVGILTNDAGAPGTDNLGVLPAEANAAAPSFSEGNAVLLSTDLAGALRVNIAADQHGGTGAGLSVGGNVAHDAVDTGNPIKIGGRAQSGTPTSVGNNDRVDGWFNLKGGLAIFPVGSDGTVLNQIIPNADKTASVMEGYPGTQAIYGVDTGGDWDRIKADGGNLEIQGDIAHDDADANFPIKIGGRAQSTLPALVADNDRVDTLHDLSGRIVTAPGTVPEMQGRLRTTLTTTTETTIAALTASEFHDLTTLTLTNESATEVRVDIRDDTAGTVLMSIDLAADGGGAISNFHTPFYQALAGDNWTAQLSAAVSSVYITAIWNRRAA